MLDPQRIPIGKLKQAYELNPQEAEAVLRELSPSGVFPYAVWQKAHSQFWKGHAHDNVRLYKLERPPQFPEAGEIPEKYFPTEVYTKWLVDFLVEMSRLICTSEFEKGFDYVIGETYDGDMFPFKEEKERLFSALNLERKAIHIRARTTIRESDFSTALPHFKFILEFFPDTVAVDKAAAVRHLHSCGYSLRREVKGLSHSLVQSIIADVPILQVQDALPSPIFVSRSLWEGKIEKSVRDGMRQQDFTDPVIAYVLHTWCGLKNKTQIGRLLGPSDLTDRSYLRLAENLLAEASALNIQHA